jgi:hypothetical protein
MTSSLKTLGIGYLMLLSIGSAMSCGPRAKVRGEVRDGFGSALGDVAVSVPGTQFRALTDADGHYEIPYAPGHFQLTFAREGYLARSLDFEVVTETTVPAEQVVLVKVPKEPGIYFWGSADYVQLGTGELTFNSVEHGFSWDRPLYTETYRVSGQFVKLPAAAALRFVDSYPKPMRLFGVDSEGRILVRQKAWLSTKDDASLVAEKNEPLAEGILRREAELPPGRYAFAQAGAIHGRGENGGPSFGAIEGHPVAEPLFIFEVVPSPAGAGAS